MKINAGNLNTGYNQFIQNNGYYGGGIYIFAASVSAGDYQVTGD